MEVTGGDFGAETWRHQGMKLMKCSKAEETAYAKALRPDDASHVGRTRKLCGQK